MISSERLTQVLDAMWDAYGTPQYVEKNAAARYFESLRQPEINSDVLGADFCKVASATGRDPWELAYEVAPHIEKMAENDSSLARFYVNWAEEMEKKASIGGLWRGAKAGVGALSRGAPKASISRQARQAYRTAAPSSTGKAMLKKAPVKAPQKGTVWSSSGGFKQSPYQTTGGGGSSWNASKTKAPVRGSSGATSAPAEAAAKAEPGKSWTSRLAGGALIGVPVLGAGYLASQMGGPPKAPTYGGY